MADINPPPETLENTTFVRTDISSWPEQAALFKQAYDAQGRLDFCGLNAGISDRDDIFNNITSDPSKPPAEPNMKTIDVNLTGQYYGIKLAAHYMNLDSAAAGKKQLGGKVVITASGSGIFPISAVPIYSATKHALVGLVRSLGPISKPKNVCVNAIAPAMVATNLPEPGFLELFPPEQITPMSTIMRCFDAVSDFEDVEKGDWVQKGKSGDIVEGNLDDLIWHPPPERPAKSEYLNEEGMKVWTDTYAKKLAAKQS
jgi:NAD(P)-dependent dehydrogenase (short-subunit alcohol dehydrogenase family)